MGIHRQKEDFPEKKMYCVPFSVIHNGVSMVITRVIITVKNRPRISLVKLVVSITYPLFLAKRETTFEVTTFERSLFRGVILSMLYVRLKIKGGDTREPQSRMVPSQNNSVESP